MKRNYIYFLIAFSILSSIIILVNSTNKSPESKPKQLDGKYNFGKRLYQKYCVSCHDSKMMEYATAPALGGITKIREKEWLYNYTKNSSDMLAEGDKIALKLRAENAGLMPSFPNLDTTEIEAIYYYIEKEFEKNKTLKTK